MDRQLQNTLQHTEIPLDLKISFSKVISMYDKYTTEEFKGHPFHEPSMEMRRRIAKVPEFTEGFSDLSLLEKHKELADLLLEPLFPEPLMNNEIKAACVPFSFNTFKYSNRLKTIIDNAEDGYVFNVRNLSEKDMYIHACTFILAYCHGFVVDLNRPFYFDVPHKELGVMKTYRVAFNADFGEIYATDKAPKITEEDFHLLLDNYDNLDLWKEKFPPNSYVFKGLGIMNLFDVTSDTAIASIQRNLMKPQTDIIQGLTKDFVNFYGIKDLKLGFSMFELPETCEEEMVLKKSTSLIFQAEKMKSCDGLFCENVITKVFRDNIPLAISDVEKYGELNQNNGFYQALDKQGIQSLILIPIRTKGSQDLAILEIASSKKRQLNSVNKSKLVDVISVFESAMERFSDEFKNTIEATIQEHYTAIHPTVKWKFYEAVKEGLKDSHNETDNEPTELEEIVFKDVYPLFGQSDIKGSSVARNNAIRDDLSTQLKLAIEILHVASEDIKLPIYDELEYRVSQYFNNVKHGLNAGDEIGILDFLRKDIYPVFNHLKTKNPKLSELVSVYMERIDPELHVIYEKRKDYENSVSLLNEELAHFIDTKQDEAQAMFPHYFERYKTDGVEYNMYIGESLVKNKAFDDIYLYNLRLWQLQLMYEMENVAHATRKKMDHDLQVASLILVHSNPLAIKFRMDEKKFDVDGAYNIRYEIIKKRIDKAHIKNTTDRLTVPGKIAIVYSQDKDAIEYMKYINFLKSKNMLGEVESLEIEDLQGVSGLKAIRVEVLYKDNFQTEDKMDLNQLLEGIESV